MEDGVGRGGPQEGSGAGVVVVGEAADFRLELGDGGEGAAADGLLRDDVEPDLDLVESGGVGGGEVEMVAGPGGQPALDASVLVGAIVVNDEVDILYGRGPRNLSVKGNCWLVGLGRFPPRWTRSCNDCICH